VFDLGRFDRHGHRRGGEQMHIHPCR
jgi:hypothetical protein